MFRIFARSLSLLVCFTLALAASSPRAQSSALQIQSASPEYTSIQWQNSDFEVQTLGMNGETYSSVDVPGEPVLNAEGYPALPHVTRIYRIPNTGSIELHVNANDYTESYDFYPIPGREEESPAWGEPVKAAEVYAVDAWYPPVVAEMSEPAIFRDFRVVTVTIYPVQVNPLTRQARFYSDIQVELVANDTPGHNELLNPRRPSGRWVPLYQDLIANLDENALDDADYRPGSYVIITNDNTSAIAWGDSLGNWKRRLGFTVTRESRNNWSTTSLRTFLTNSYNNWDPPLEFACIIGDVNGSFAVPTGDVQWDGDYDHGYADLIGNDDYEEIGIGRLSASSATQLATVVNKQFIYERTPYMDDPSWFQRAFLYAGTGSGISSNEIMALWGADMFRNYTGVINPSVSTHNGNVSNTLIGQRLTEGVSYFLWRGTVVGEMDASAATSMSSTPKLPVALTITCGSGDYDGSGLNEAWLQAGTATAPKGGVCGIGTATWNTHVSYNNTVAGGLIYYICNVGVRYLGTALSGAKVELIRAFPGSNNDMARRFTRWNNLMGDPGLSLWTDVPVVMNVTHPSTVNVGARRVRPQVVNAATDEPIADALVVIHKGDETFVKDFTDAGGFVDMPVTVNTQGLMTITVSKRNHKPYLADITCVNAPEMVTVQSVSVDDDNSNGTSGNGNGEYNPGETIDLAVTMRNFGTEGTASAISVEMTCTDPEVTLLQTNSTYPDIAAGAQAAGNQAFRIQLANTMRHEQVIKLTFGVTTATGVAYSTSEFQVKAADCAWVSHAVTGGNNNNRLDPGETAFLRITVRNEGGQNMEGVTGHLISRHSLLSVSDGECSFGTIAVGSTAQSGVNELTIRGNSVAYPGSLGNVALVVQTSAGFTDTVAFAIAIGQASTSDPTGPDAYGYYAYDGIDTDYEYSRPYEWTDISTIGTRLTRASADPGEQQPSGQTNSDAIALPFPFTFYGETYDTITVCSNGWAAFGSQAHLDMFRNYPIPGSQTPDAFVSPFWDDLKTNGTGDGVWVQYDEANHRFVIEWNATGAFTSSAVDFQAILLDEEYYPTDDNNGILIFQYQTAQSIEGDGSETPYETVGIAMPRSLVGLQYRFGGVNNSGAQGIGNQRAVTITTEARRATGIISGVVVDQATGFPLDNVQISLDGEEDWAETNALGQFTMIDVEIGTYVVRASRFGYNDGVISDFVVEMDSSEIANFNLLHPEASLSVEALDVNIPGDPTEQIFNITNAGNGQLDFRISVEYSHESGEGGAWATVDHLDVSANTGDQQILGAAFHHDQWWVSGGAGPSGPNYLYRYDLQGNYLGSVVQPTSSQFGYYDLASDGGLLYGGTDGVHEIQGFDDNGNLVTTIPCPLSPARCIAYDPALDQFWVADNLTAVYCFDRSGNEIHRFGNDLRKSGFAWHAQDPDGYKLYIYHRDENQHGCFVSKLHPMTGSLQSVAEISDQDDDAAGGCDITTDWNSMLTVFGGVLQNSGQGDRFEMKQLEFHTDWIGITPLISSVLPEASRDISVLLEPNELRDLTYHVNILVHNNSSDSLLVLPITLHKTLDADEIPAALPSEFALMQNYPNPFNP
ncbi:carboxypeptidase regulatory-like domain-containing protein, partial [bacterium]|nr:carboxypeptidase regulatory-like domain-containing protein [bacterium]